MTEHPPKRVKLTIINQSGGSDQFVKISAVGGQSTIGGTICKLTPVTFVDQTMPELNETPPEAAALETAIVFSGPSPPPPSKSVMDRKKETFQSVFEQRFLEHKKKTSVGTNEDFYRVESSSFSPTPEFRSPKEVVCSTSITQQTVTIPPEVISQMMSNSNVIVAPANMVKIGSGLHEVAGVGPSETEMEVEGTLEDLPTKVADVGPSETEMEVEGTLEDLPTKVQCDILPNLMVGVQEQEQLPPPIPEPCQIETTETIKEEVLAPVPPNCDEVISIGTDSEATELDEDEIERLRNHCIDLAADEEAPAFDREEEFSDFFDQPIGDDTHENIVKEILEDKIKNLSKDDMQLTDTLEEQLLKITGEVSLNYTDAIPSTSNVPVEIPLTEIPPPEQVIPLVNGNVAPTACNEQAIETEQLLQLDDVSVPILAPTSNVSLSDSDIQSVLSNFPASPAPKPPEQEQRSSTPIQKSTEIEGVVQYLQRIETRLQNIENRLHKIEKRDCEDESDDTMDNDVFLSMKFPVRRRAGLEVLENVLKVPKMKHHLQLKFKLLRGINEMDTIDMILTDMLQSTLHESFKWHHTDAQRSFKSYEHINQLIFECVQHHYRLFTAVEYARLMTLILNRPQRRQLHDRHRESRASSLSSLSQHGSTSLPSTSPHPEQLYGDRS